MKDVIDSLFDFGVLIVTEGEYPDMYCKKKKICDGQETINLLIGIEEVLGVVR